MLAGVFERPARFSLAAHWARITAELEQKQRRFPVVLALASEAAQRLRAHLPTAEAERSSGLDLPRDWVTVQADFDEEEQARFVVLGMGARARVIAPSGFQQSLAAEARMMAGLGKVRKSKRRRSSPP
jgi:predicted DNA-binding transcriptional regulator YafY